MIRLATDRDFSRPITDETALRIFALRQAYGMDVPFIRYYADDEGSLLSVMDGVGLFSSLGPMAEEWCQFLCMYPDMQYLHCTAESGRTLGNYGEWHCRTGVVLQYRGKRRSVRSDAICHTPPLPAVYDLLQQCFDTLPPFEAWYPDVSHRIRHGCCQIAAILDGKRVVSTAMTVAEAEEYALLGQVATDAAYRRRGYAGRCLNDLIDRWQGKRLYIIPANENARKLYEKLGFSFCEEWAELSRIQEGI